MKLKSLALEEFRCYRSIQIELPSDGIRLYGRNASGKTSLLEAIYLLATTRSPRASLDRELINWNSNEEYGLAPFARVQGTVQQGDSERQIEITLQSESSDGSTSRKRVKLEGRARRAVDVIGHLKVVLFEPEDLSLVLGSPSIRRRYLDISISQLDPTYLRSLSKYGRLLEQRNSLLKSIASRGAARSAEEELSFWDGEVVRLGSYIVAARFKYLAGLEREAGHAFGQLAGEHHSLEICYQPSLQFNGAVSEKIANLGLGDGQLLVQRAFEESLRDVRGEELRRGSTVIGPHRDDFAVRLDGRNLSAFGSRGQQRLAVVALKLAELRQVVLIADERPVLLLDDVLSELDARHQESLLQTLGVAECQTFITATDRAPLEQPSLERLQLVEVVSGMLREVHSG